MAKRDNDDVINIPLGTTRVLRNELKWIASRSILLILIYHMNKKFELMAERKIIR